MAVSIAGFSKPNGIDVLVQKKFESRIVLVDLMDQSRSVNFSLQAV